MFSHRVPVEVVGCQAHHGSPITSSCWNATLFHLLFVSIAHWPRSTQCLGFFFSSAKAVIHGSLASCWVHWCRCQKSMTVELCYWCFEFEHRAAEHNRLSSRFSWRFKCAAVSKGAAGGQKDTVSPREQHCPSYHLSKDAAHWPHVHWTHTHEHTHMYMDEHGHTNSTYIFQPPRWPVYLLHSHIHLGYIFWSCHIVPNVERVKNTYQNLFPFKFSTYFWTCDTQLPLQHDNMHYMPSCHLCHKRNTPPFPSPSLHGHLLNTALC